jgi:hypothetical protein
MKEGPFMVVQTRRPGVSKVAQFALQFLSDKLAEAGFKKTKDQARDSIKNYLVPDEDAIDSHDVFAGNPNKVRVDPEKGHRYYDFPKPVVIDGKKFTALELQRKVTGPYYDVDEIRAYFNPDPDETSLKPAELNRRLELWREIYVPVTEYIVDTDVIARLQQQGRISKAEVNALMKTSISWSLNAKDA